MSSASSIKAGGAYVDLFVRDSRLVAGLRAASAKLKAFGAATAAIGARMLGFGAALGAPLLLATRQAGNATESLSRFAAVFGDQAQSAAAFAEQLGQSVGRSALDVKDAMSSYMSFFVGLGFGREEANRMSQELVSLGLDLSSFHNLADQEGFDRFLSALAGSAEVLDRFGVNIRAAALDEEFLRQGMNITTATANEQQKTLARLAIIRRSLGDQGAIGDAARTAGSFNNQLKRLMGNIKDTAVVIGNALIPSLTLVVSWLGEAAGIVGEFIAANSAVVLIAGGAAAGLLTIGASMMLLGPAISAVGTAVGIVAGTISAILTPIGLVVAAIAAGTAAWMTWTDSGRAALGSVMSVATGLGDTFRTSMGGVLDAISLGDIEAAFNIAILGMRLAWAQFTDWFGKSFVGGAIEVISQGLSNIWSQIRGLHFELTGGRMVQEAQQAADLQGQQMVVALAARIKANRDAGRAFEDLPAPIQALARQHNLHPGAVGGINWQGTTGAAPTPAAALVSPEIAALQRELAELTAQIRTRREERDERLSLFGQKERDNLRKSGLAARIVAGLDQASARINIAGTFSGTAVAGLGAGENVTAQRHNELIRAVNGVRRAVEGGGEGFA